MGFVDKNIEILHLNEISLKFCAEANIIGY